jgi:predicted PurR-regulated permease PerM
MSNPAYQPDPVLEKRISDRALDVLIRAGLVLALTLLCYQIMSPFITMLVWSVILAVTLYPMHCKLAARLGGRQGRAATLIVLLGAVLIVWPTTALMNSLGDSLHGLVNGVKDNTLQIPAPKPGVAQWPLVGERVFALWSSAHSDLPSVVASMQPKIGDLAKASLGFVASIGGGVLKFLFSFVIAGVIMAFGENGAAAARRILQRIGGSARGAQFTLLATQTIRAVALGVIGIAFIQAILVGLALLVAGIPWSGVLAIVVLVLGIAQIPALIVTLPAIGYIWTSGLHDTGMAVAYTVVLLVSGSADNVLKPLLLGRGVDAPMPVILLGALGGMASAGILGMFVGATLLALGYQIFMGWVDQNPDLPPGPVPADPVNPS